MYEYELPDELPEPPGGGTTLYEPAAEGRGFFGDGFKPREEPASTEWATWPVFGDFSRLTHIPAHDPDADWPQGTGGLARYWRSLGGTLEQEDE